MLLQSAAGRSQRPGAVGIILRHCWKEVNREESERPYHRVSSKTGQKLCGSPPHTRTADRKPGAVFPSTERLRYNPVFSPSIRKTKDDSSSQRIRLSAHLRNLGEPVRNTQDFLAEEDFLHYKEVLPSYFPHFRLAGWEEDGRLLGFIGTSADNIEALFVDNEARGKGIGKALLLRAINDLHIYKVDVNEQNGQAVGFYEHMGYKVVSRDELDPEGKPYPILHMVWEKAKRTRHDCRGDFQTNRPARHPFLRPLRLPSPAAPDRPAASVPLPRPHACRPVSNTPAKPLRSVSLRTLSLLHRSSSRPRPKGRAQRKPGASLHRSRPLLVPYARRSASFASAIGGRPNKRL